MRRTAVHEETLVGNDPARPRYISGQQVGDPLAIFPDLDPTAVALIQAHLAEETFPANQVIFEDGAPGDCLYIIKSGWLRVSKTLDNGQEHTLAELGPGEMFGEMALLEHKPRSARVSTRTPVHLWVISHQTFDMLITHHPLVAVQLLKTVSTRLRARSHELEQTVAELRAAMQTVAEHERVKRDLEIARHIQQQMLPRDFPRLEGLQLHATMVPSRWVGGDFYDAVDVGEQRLGLLLGDVSGKGIPAAMQMARLMGEFRACMRHSPAPASVLQLLNELLCARSTGWTSFVTVQYLVLELTTRRAQFICAGHPPILVHRQDGRVEQFGTVANLPLGIDTSFVYQHEEGTFAPGDRFLLYSDGAYEVHNATGELFGLTRLTQAFAEAPATPTAAIAFLQQTLHTFHAAEGLDDDTTLVCAAID
jgi:sigma-B regulation protein RsbU (phosphoserine phosphatase)